MYKTIVSLPWLMQGIWKSKKWKLEMETGNGMGKKWKCIFLAAVVLARFMHTVWHLLGTASTGTRLSHQGTCVKLGLGIAKAIIC